MATVTFSWGLYMKRFLKLGGAIVIIATMLPVVPAAAQVGIGRPAPDGEPHRGRPEDNQREFRPARLPIGDTCVSP